MRLKRGAIKAFREFLNELCKDYKHRHDAGGRHRYEQKTRAYGDYLYAQDREMFDQELRAAMRGEIKGWNPDNWKLQEQSGE